jgi:hypothetical protein
MKDGEVIFDYNKKNRDVYISYDIWLFLDSFFGMEYKEIQDLLKQWVEKHYKLRVRRTGNYGYTQTIRWRNITN